MVEDAAQAFGARNHGSSVGLEGDAGFFSFAVGKGLTMYEGGFVGDAVCGTGRRLRTDEPGDHSTQHRAGTTAVCGTACIQPCISPLPCWLLFMEIRFAKSVDQGNIAEAIGDVFSPAIPLHRVGAWKKGCCSSGAAAFAGFVGPAKGKLQN